MISPELLRRFPFFGFMNEAQLRAVAMIAEETNHNREGEALVEAGREADRLHFLIDGRAAYYCVVTTENHPDYVREYYISDLNPGELIGISGLIEPYVYTATVRVEKPCRLIEINAPALRALCEADARLSAGLMHAAARAAMERLEHTRTQLVAAMA